MVFGDDDYGGMKVKKFSGMQHEWQEWMSDLLAILDNKDNLVELLLPGAEARPTETGAAQVKWDKTSRKIYMKLVLFTSGTAKSMVLQFGDTMNGVAAWDVLKEKYEMRGRAQKTMLQEKFEFG